MTHDKPDNRLFGRRAALDMMLRGPIAAAFFRGLGLQGQDMPESGQYCLYIGTYTRGESEGIYRLSLGAANGEMRLDGVARDVENPSFLAVHPGKRVLYAVNETGVYNGKPGGAVSAFAIGTGNDLEFINRQATHGAAPCHVAVDRTGGWAFTANYSGGNITVFPIREDGSLDSASDVLPHEGAGPDRRRQEKPHPHSINVSPDNRFVIAADLGIDKLVVYRFDAKSGELVLNNVPFHETAPGAGPRHMAFHPGGRHAFLINELNCTMQALSFDREAGTFSSLDTVPVPPAGGEEEYSCADVRVSPCGKFVYGSTRGHDSIAVFSFDSNAGTLRRVAHHGSRGRTPRSFAITPDGLFLVAANQNGNNVVSYFRDKKTGGLAYSGFEIEIHNPVCVSIL